MSGAAPVKQNLSVKEKFGYGLGDTASNIVYQAVLNMLSYFYTDIYGIEAAAVGTLMLVVRLFDTFTDPAMGAIADRTRSKHGRYRPWLLWIAIPYGILAVAAFVTPDFEGMRAKLIYAYITYGLLMTAYTAINIPYSALAGVMTADKDERSSLQSWRFGLAMIGGFLVTSITLPLARTIGGGGDNPDMQFGMPIAMGVLAAVGILCFFGCFKFTKERVYPEQEVDAAGNSKQNVFDDIKMMFGNSQWVIVTLAMFIIQIRGGMFGAIKPHFTKYYMQSDLGVINFYFFSVDFSVNENFIGLVLGLTMLAGVAGVIAANRLFMVLHWCKVSVMKLALFGSLIPYGLIFTVPRDWWEATLCLILLANFFHMMFIPLLFAAIPDTVDYGLKTVGKAAIAMFFAGQLFALKMGGAIGGSMALWIMALFGFQPNVEQTDSALLGLRIAFAGIPFIAAIIVAIVISFYKLKKDWESNESIIGRGVEPQV